MCKKIVYIDLDDTACDYSGAYQCMREKHPEMAFPQSQYGFYANLKPIPGAVEALIALLESENYEPYILTAPSTYNPLSYTEKRAWVERHLGMEYVERLIISPVKHLSRGDYLIDDSSQGRGQEMFEGELILFGSSKYPDWGAVRAKLGM